MEMNVSRDKRHALIETGLSVLALVSMLLPAVKVVATSATGMASTTFSYWNLMTQKGAEGVFWVMALVYVVNIVVQNIRKCTWLSYYVSLIPLYFAGSVLAMSDQSINVIFVTGNISTGIGAYLALICGLVMLIRTIIEMGMHAREHKVFWRVYWIILGVSFLLGMLSPWTSSWFVLFLLGMLWILQLPMLLGALLSLIMHLRRKGNGEIQQPQQPQQQPQPQPARPASSNASSGTNRKPLLIAGAALVVVVGIVLLVFCRGGEKDGPFRGQWQGKTEFIALNLYEPDVQYRDSICYGCFIAYDDDMGCDLFNYCIGEVKNIKGNTATIVYYDYFMPTNKGEITITYNKEDGSLHCNGKEDGSFPSFSLPKLETPIDTSSF